MSFAADQVRKNCMSRPKYQRHHGWFVGYAPADNPEIVFGILGEHACHGSNVAPVAREVVRAFVAKYHPEWLAREPLKHIHVPSPAEEERIEGE